MNSHPNYALITGASKGLGYMLAQSLARRGYHLIMVSLPGENLEQKAREIQAETNIDARYYECDLTQKKELERLVFWVKQNFSLQILINNAGMGCTKAFDELTVDQTDQILSLNIRSVVLLTHALLPLLQKQKQAYVLNISSLAAFLPMPYKSVYPASKSFIYSFSRGLYAELKGSNVFVGVVHPGGMVTNPEVSQRIRKADGITKATILSVEHTAEICIRRLLKQHPMIIPGLMNKLVWLITRIVPDGWILAYLRKDMKMADGKTFFAARETIGKDIEDEENAGP